MDWSGKNIQYYEVVGNLLRNGKKRVNEEKKVDRKERF